MFDKTKKIIQQRVKVKKVARLPNLVLDIPEEVSKRPFIYKKASAAISTSETDEVFYLIYEFNKMADENGEESNE